MRRFCGSIGRLWKPGDGGPNDCVGRLAVDRAYTGKGLGTDLLVAAFRRIVLASQTIGIAAVPVHAKDETARRFYLHAAEFIEYPDGSRTLFLPIETVIAGIG